MRRGIIVCAVLLSTTASACAWSFTDDPEGQKLDAEARKVLTTQNVCGAVVEAGYLKSLYARINKHFDRSLEYPLYLRRSVLSANSDYLAGAETPQITSDCKPRIDELRKLKILVE